MEKKTTKKDLSDYKKSVIAFAKACENVKVMDLLARLIEHLDIIQKGEATKQLKKLIAELESTPTFTKYLNKVLKDVYKDKETKKGFATHTILNKTIKKK